MTGERISMLETMSFKLIETEQSAALGTGEILYIFSKLVFSWLAKFLPSLPVSLITKLWFYSHNLFKINTTPSNTFSNSPSPGQKPGWQAWATQWLPERTSQRHSCPLSTNTLIHSLPHTHTAENPDGGFLLIFPCSHFNLSDQFIYIQWLTSALFQLFSSPRARGTLNHCIMWGAIILYWQLKLISHVNWNSSDSLKKKKSYIVAFEKDC